MKTQLCIVGAGPAGLMAAIFAARRGIRTLVVERNSTAGRKLLKTGRGRCNLTHVGTPEELARACEPYGRFLKHAFYTFGPDRVRRFFHEQGLETKVEADGCVFPLSDRATDVKAVLLDAAARAGVRFIYGRRVFPMAKEPDGFILHSEDLAIRARAVVIATGGASWPQTGSTGDGYALAAGLGHGIIEPRAILVPLVTREAWPGALQGVGVEHVVIRSRLAGIKHAEATGPMMFTQDGLGGPAVLNLSRRLAGLFDQAAPPVELHIDLFDGLTAQALEQRLITSCQARPRKRIETILAEWLPGALAERLCTLAGCAETQASQLSRPLREALVRMLKDVTVHVVRTRPLREATATRGGVDHRQIEPTTMQSRICPGLYLAGEVIDADGPCGGYNLQIAFATGALAGQSVTVPASV